MQQPARFPPGNFVPLHALKRSGTGSASFAGWSRIRGITRLRPFGPSWSSQQVGFGFNHRSWFPTATAEVARGALIDPSAHMKNRMPPARMNLQYLVRIPAIVSVYQRHASTSLSDRNQRKVGPISRAPWGSLAKVIRKSYYSKCGPGLACGIKHCISCRLAQSGCSK